MRILPHVALPLLAAVCLHAQPASSGVALRGFSEQFQALVARVDPAVVQIVTRGFAPSDAEGLPMLRARKGSGSGVVVDPAGYIVTNAHVVGTARRVDVLLPEPADAPKESFSVLKPAGRLVPAVVVGQDRETDIAVLKIEGAGLPFVRFADSELLRQGQIVFAFGSPFGLENSVTMGVVSSAARQVRTDDPMIYIQTDASINPGNSGGPLIDTEGMLVGINTFIVGMAGAGNSIGFAAPANIVRRVYEQIREHGRVRRGQIGLQVQTITPGLAEALKLPRTWGAIVGDVAPGGAAESAGFRIGDIILTLNGKVIENARQFGVNIYASAGRQVAVDVLRGGERLTIQSAVLERPRDPDRILSLVTGERNLVPRLGIVAVDLDEKVLPLLPQLRRFRGVVVAGVVADLSAEEDSLNAGDVIYAVNGSSIGNIAELRAAVEPLAHGKPVAVQIERGGQFQFLVLEID